MAHDDDIAKVKDKFVNIWAGKKLKADGCFRRHDEPRHMQEMDEYTSNIKSFEHEAEQKQWKINDECDM